MGQKLSERKDKHLDLCLNQDVEHQTSTLLDQVQLVHNALPELDLDDIRLERSILGKTLKAPLLISGMTGGTPRATAVNRDLACAAQRAQIGFGVGSQRPMAENPDLVESYQVRKYAPDILLFGNLGAQQLMAMGSKAAAELMRRIEADAIFIHLNPAQELVQPEGDRHFSGCLRAISELVKELGERVWVKETGAGLSLNVAKRLVDAGVGGLDVSGAGGTSWTRVETLRASGAQRELGELLSGWGIPTAAALAVCAKLPVPVVASGGLRTPLDVLRTLVLGASLGSMALPYLRAQDEGGADAVVQKIDDLSQGLRSIMLLVGAGNLETLPRLPRILGGSLSLWIDELSREL